VFLAPAYGQMDLPSAVMSEHTRRALLAMPGRIFLPRVAGRRLYLVAHYVNGWTWTGHPARGSQITRWARLYIHNQAARVVVRRARHEAVSGSRQIEVARRPDRR
jgi:hypothetical protein